MWKSNKYVRVFLSEVLGSFLLVLIGDAAVAQVILGDQLKKTIFGGFLNIALGYGMALAVGIMVSGAASGGHLNPAVSLGLAAVGKLRPLPLLPVYWLAQYLGSFLGAATVWGVYSDAIKLAEPNGTYSTNTRGIFASYPMHAQYSTAVLAGDQILGTAILLLIICAVTDTRNSSNSLPTTAFSIGLGLTAIHLGFGLISGSAINPARDFSPRALSAIGGWAGAFTAGDYWFWIPWLLPHVGGVVGAGLYMLLVELHHPQDTPTPSTLSSLHSNKH